MITPKQAPLIIAIPFFDRVIYRQRRHFNGHPIDRNLLSPLFVFIKSKKRNRKSSAIQPERSSLIIVEF